MESVRWMKKTTLLDRSEENYEIDVGVDHMISARSHTDQLTNDVIEKRTGF